MKNINNIIVKLDKKFIDNFTEYNRLQKELDKFRGQTINDDRVSLVNDLLTQIYKIYEEMAPMCNWITERHKDVMQFSHHFNQFYASIQKNIEKTKN